MNDSHLIVATKAQLGDLVTAAVERAVARHTHAAPPQQERPRVGYLSNREAMSALGLSKSTLARFRADGTLPFSRLGGSVYYRIEDIEAVLESRRVRKAA